MLSPPSLDPLVCDEERHATQSDPKAAMAACSGSNVPYAKIKEKKPNDSRMGKINPDNLHRQVAMKVLIVATE